MKIRRLLVIGVFFLTGSLLLISCTKTPTDEVEPLYGIWGNEDAPQMGKLIYTQDGKIMVYGELTGVEAMGEGHFTIEEKWTDEEGNIYYKTIDKIRDLNYGQEATNHYYMIHKISPSGDMMEVSASRNEYPEDVGPAYGSRWKLLYRQEE